MHACTHGRTLWVGNSLLVVGEKKCVEEGKKRQRELVVLMEGDMPSFPTPSSHPPSFCPLADVISLPGSCPVVSLLFLSLFTSVHLVLTLMQRRVLWVLSSGFSYGTSLHEFKVTKSFLSLC